MNGSKAWTAALGNRVAGIAMASVLLFTGAPFAVAETDRAPRQTAQLIFEGGKLYETEPGSVPGVDPVAPGADAPGGVAPVPLPRVRFGAIPHLPSAPLYVMAGEKLDEANGFRAQTNDRIDDDAIIADLATGRLDAAYVDLGKVITAQSVGTPLTVIAGVTTDSVAMISRGALSDWTVPADIDLPSNAASDLRLYIRDRRKRIVFLTSDRDTVPYIATQKWLYESAELLEIDARVRGLSQARAFRYIKQATVSGLVATEPMLSAVIKQDETARIILSGNQMMPGQPTSVLAVRRSLIGEDRSIVGAIIKAHLAAIRALLDAPEDMARYFQRPFAWAELTDTELVELTRSPYIRFQTNPEVIAPMALAVHNILLENGRLRNKVSLHRLFNVRLYREFAETM